jgi:hypothetical protein
MGNLPARFTKKLVRPHYPKTFEKTVEMQENACFGRPIEV